MDTQTLTVTILQAYGIAKKLLEPETQKVVQKLIDKIKETAIELGENIDVIEQEVFDIANTIADASDDIIALAADIIHAFQYPDAESRALYKRPALVEKGVKMLKEKI